MREEEFPTQLYLSLMVKESLFILSRAIQIQIKDALDHLKANPIQSSHF